MNQLPQEARDNFVILANELIDQLEDDLEKFIDRPHNIDQIIPSCCAMYIIEFISGTYGFEFICEFTQKLGRAYQVAYENKLYFSKQRCDILFSSFKHLRKLLGDKKLRNPDNLINHYELMNDIAFAFFRNLKREEGKEFYLNNITHVVVRLDKNGLSLKQY